jgi:L-ascorbate metabolism protein UlaG (beta-lactamase superfamily)
MSASRIFCEHNRELPMPPYRERYPVGSTIRIADLPRLEEFQRTWQWHHNVPPEHLIYAGSVAKIIRIGYYHGGDVLYDLEGVPGTWLEQCLDPTPPDPTDVTDLRITHIGGPTVLLEFGGWRLLTDPTFDPPGGRYHFGWGAISRKLAGPAIAAAEIGPIDAVLLSHDHHDDNLDPAGRALLPLAGAVFTTEAGARRLAGGQGALAPSGPAPRGLAPWAVTWLQHDGRVPIEITATPCRHGPPFSRPITGDVIGFALAWEGQAHGPLWISGDTVLYDGVREVARRLKVGTALVHLGGVRFPFSGPLRYTMNAEEAVELCGLMQPQTIVPIHYEGWSHFREGRTAAEQAFAAAPASVAEHVHWLEIGKPAVLHV